MADSKVINRSFRIRFDSPGIEVDGVRLWTPVTGEIISAILLSIPEVAWDGVTPLGDFGQFVNGSSVGILGQSGGGALDMTHLDTGGDDSDPSTVSVPFTLVSDAWIFLTRNPVFFIINQTGTLNGAASGSTKGEATFTVTSLLP